MPMRMLFLSLLLLGGILLFGHAPQAWAAPYVQASTPTPAPEEEGHNHEEADTHDHAATADHAMTETVTLDSLAARITALEAEVAALSAPASGTNEVVTAIYLLDNAGLHDLDDRLNGDGTIEASDSGRVARVARLLTAVTWPDGLATTAMSTTVTLTELAAALADDDRETAAALATTAHDLGHELSHAMEHWLDEAATGSAHDDSDGQLFRVTSAVYLLDNVGLHDLDVRLNESQELQAGDAGKVERISRLLTTVDWPEPLATTAISVTTVLDQLAAALTDDDLATAAPLATEAHDLGHELSHTAEIWLFGARGADDHGTDDHGAADDHDHATEEEGEAEDDGHSHSSGG